MKSKIKLLLISIYTYLPDSIKALLSRTFFSQYLISKVFKVKVSQINDSFEDEITKRLDRLYRKNRYGKYMAIFEANKSWLSDRGHGKYFSWAAVITKGTEASLEYICEAVYIQPRAINDITTAIVEDAYPIKDKFSDKLARAGFESQHFSPIFLTLVLIKKGEIGTLEKVLSKSYVRDVYDDKELIETYSLIGKNRDLIALFRSSNDSALINLSTFELVYDSMTKLGMLDEAAELFERADRLFNEARSCLNKKINPHSINNKLERQFWFQKGNIVRAYSTYKRQRLSQVLANHFGEKYTQSLNEVVHSQSLLVLSSWGPGDEIRFSKLYPKLVSLNENVTITCEPRLTDILRSSYPMVNFLPTYRSRRVDLGNQGHFDKLPVKKLHHVLDNDTYKKVGSFSKLCLFTDLLSDLIEETPTSEVVPPLDRVTSKNTKLKVGISWRSSIQTAGRSEHYFSLSDFKSLFEKEGVELYSLQYGDCRCEIEYVRSTYGVDIRDPGLDQYNDFMSVLNFMNELDVILSVGTTVLELSGLSDTPVFVLTNSKAFTYRCLSNNRDLWFENINYIHGFTTMSKEDVVSKIVDTICDE